MSSLELAGDVDVLVLGASLLGIELVRRLRGSRRGARLRLAVIDQRARHAYIPLIQERLTDRISAEASVLDTAAYVRAVEGDRFVQGEVVAFDPAARTATLADGTRWRGRHVVIALGSVVEPPAALRGGPRVGAVKFGEQLARVRGEIELLREAARPGDPRRVVVVGGGITGVELAGELAVLRARDPEPRLEVTLVHGGDRLLPHLTPRAGARTARLLEAQGVDLRVATRLLGVHAEGVRLYEQTPEGAHALDMPTDLLLWAGGISPPPVTPSLGLPLDDAGWVVVAPTLQPFPGRSGARAPVFAGGDLVRVEGGEGRWPTMQRAIEALWQAKTIARNLLELAAADADDPDWPPPLRPHRTWRDFAHGVSVGARSLVVWGPLVLDLGRFNVRFRRWLMRQYLARYAP